MLTGRITSGSVKAGSTVKALARDGRLIETFRVSKVLAFRGLERAPIDVGMDDEPDFPEHYLAQLAWPFRARPPA